VPEPIGAVCGRRRKTINQMHRRASDVGQSWDCLQCKLWITEKLALSRNFQAISFVTRRPIALESQWRQLKMRIFVCFIFHQMGKLHLKSFGAVWCHGVDPVRLLGPVTKIPSANIAVFS